MYWLHRFLLLGLLVIPLWPAPVSAQVAPQFYDRETLSYWQQRYQQSMARMLQELQPFLTADAKRDLAEIRLEIPLTPPDPANPFLFYSDPVAATVTMPALSLKFLDDLSVAYAWLSLNGCSLETPAEYISMLKYNRPSQFAGGRYPMPLAALQIPEDALEDPAVDELSLAFFNHARAYILAHELGHVYCGHPGYGPGTTRAAARRHEAAADRFALEILRKSGTIPVGMVTYFLGWAHYAPNRWDFEGEADWQEYLDQATHPLTSDRLSALATTLEANIESFTRNQPDPAAEEKIRSIAGDIAGIAHSLDDRDVQAAITLAASTTVQNLAPRCPESAATATPLPALPPFDGIYQGDFIYRTIAGQETLPVEVTLQRTDDQVTGRFDFGLGAGLLYGTVVENTLHFTWEWGWMVGQGVFYASQDGASFEGYWGVDRSQDNGGRWRGQRIQKGVEAGEGGGG